ncbi:MAG: hypothetical protein E7231_12205 [Cellulosilyticum sp.]|nr:hypothetical protein [Cellulosilyticum sp.]
MKKAWRTQYKKLTGKNKKFVKKMMQYLQSSNMNIIAYEEVIEENIHKVLELQEQNRRLTEVYGYDEEQYCEDLVAENKKQGLLERGLETLQIVSLCFGVLLVCQYILIAMGGEPLESVNGIYMQTSIGSLGRVGLYGGIGMLGGYLGQRMTYKGAVYRIMSVIVYAFIFVGIEELVLGMGYEGIITIHMPLVVGILLGIGVLFGRIRRIVAKRKLEELNK